MKIISTLGVEPEGLDTESKTMRAIVVTDEAAETAGMMLVDRAEREAPINDVACKLTAVPRDVDFVSIGGVNSAIDGRTIGWRYRG
ncbi:hypothetical protein SAMN05216345_12615 [Cupriavidus sp. YR651]|uniref:hypothetical protein n=1 Tax=Cupriavidus sp. YR651 TaxID=1855315 RepID=UPI00088A7352|nr:hypothetical protein [Cupriavidus sp. YR651]SDD97964.1 hypothetical protein SAMN05216345_12615 [Cupriavidus sp. YR651]